MTMHRAYSLMTLKAVDEDNRTITGIATTPEVDRVGDIVEPKGAEFKLPLPFLWQHNSDEPIGHVTAAKVTKDGIEITAQVTKWDKEGKLKDRLDEAWDTLKAGLVRGLSIGFQSVESARIDGTYGIRFMKWLWLELSAVTIPANIGASIQTVKAYDTEQRAALGAGNRVVRLTSPGASGTTKDSKPVVHLSPKPQEGDKTMNIKDQIKSFENERAAKVARVTALLEGAEGSSLDAEKGQEYDDLKQEIDTIDKHLERLNDTLKLVEPNGVKAVPVTTGSAATPEEIEAASRRARNPTGDNVVAVARKLEPGCMFARYAGVVAHGKGNLRDSIEFAKERFPNEKPIHDVLKMFVSMDPETILKAAVAAGTTSDATWAAPLVQYNDMQQDFIDYLRPQTVIGKIPGLRRVPFNIRIPRQTSGGSAYWVGQNAPKPVTSLAFDNITMKWTKLANIAVITQELARFSNPSAETIIRDALAKAIIQEMDTSFIDPDNAGTTDVQPASITNGVTPIQASGTNEAALRADIASVFAPFIAANMTPETGVWVMSSTTALKISLMVNSLGQPSFPGITLNGGTLWGMPVVVSQAAGLVGDSTGDQIIVLLNASDILLADDGQVAIDVSNQASVQMNNTPDNPETAATVLRSLWQDNLIGIRAERFVNWMKARAQAVQYIHGANYH